MAVIRRRGARRGGMSKAQGDATYAALAGQSPKRFGQLPGPVVAGRLWRPGGVQNLNNVTFQRIYRLYETTGLMRLVFINFYLPSGSSPTENAPGTFDLKVCVNFQYQAAGSVIVPVYFDGQRTITMSPYQVAISDPIPVDPAAVAGTWFVVRSYVTNVAGAYLPVSTDSFNQNSWNEGYLAGDITDTTNSYGGATQMSYSFAPYAVCGWPASGKHKTVLVTGDSIPSGTGDQIQFGANGFAANVLQSNQVPAISITRSSELAQKTSTLGEFMRRLNLINGFRYVIDEYGINDITTRTAAQIKADLVAWWSYLVNVRGASKVFRTTLTPKTTSTDNWQTTANQTVTANEAVRLAVNAWLMAPASAGAGVSAAFDAAALGVTLVLFDTGATIEVNANGTAITRSATTGAISNGAGGFWKVDATQYDTGTVTSIPTSQKLADNTKSWTVSQYVGYSVVILTDSGTPAAVGQVRIISANTATQLTSDTAWSTTPSTSATYAIVKGYTTDGIHPQSFAHRLMEAAVDTTQLVAA